jgi:hypothetical protein
MAWRTWAGIATAVILVAAVGCGPARLNVEKKFSVGLDVKPAEGWALPAQSVEQTLKVEVSSSAPVDVFVLTGVNSDDAVVMFADELKKKAVTSKEDVKQDTITAKIPANQPATVVVRFNSKKENASGTIKMTN